MHNLIPILIATVAIATILNVVLKRFNMPTVIGYIFTGAIIGTVFDIHLHGNETLEHVAEFGSEQHEKRGVSVWAASGDCDRSCDNCHNPDLF
jgi:hypothetical protein